MPYLSRNTRFFCPLVLALLLFTLPGCSYSENRRAKAIAHGNDLFEMHCSGCHSRRRLDLEKVPPDLHGVFDRRVLPSGRSATDDLVRSTILTGRSGIMPSFEGSLSEEDIEDIILYLHTLKVLPRAGSTVARHAVVFARIHGDLSGSSSEAAESRLLWVRTTRITPLLITAFRRPRDSRCLSERARTSAPFGSARSRLLDAARHQMESVPN